VELDELKVTRYAAESGVATITLDRPHRLNAWTGRMHTEYRALLDRAAGDPGVRVIVVTGAGRGFCAGADTTALQGHVERGAYDAGTGEELSRGVVPPWSVAVGATRPRAFPGGTFGLPCMLVVSRLEEGQRHPKAQLEELLRAHSAGTGGTGA